MSTDNPFDADNLRQKAEKILTNKPSSTDPAITEIERLKLLHDLDVHRIELELQNEELRHAWAVGEVALNRYAELYDFAPSGYFTLTKEGEIVDLNLVGAILLGRERMHLKHCRFGVFVSDDTKPVFNHFLNCVFGSRTRESCELILSGNPQKPMFVHLAGIAAEKKEHCLVTAVDITERHHLEVALKQQVAELEQMNRCMMDRELKMVELKQEINELLGKAGGKAKYEIHT